MANEDGLLQWYKLQHKEYKRLRDIAKRRGTSREVIAAEKGMDSVKRSIEARLRELDRLAKVWQAQGGRAEEGRWLLE